MTNIYLTGLPEIEKLTLKECMEQSFSLVDNLKKSPTIMQISLEFDKKDVDALLLVLKDIDTSIFPFGKQPFENLKNSLQNTVLTAESASNEQYFFFVYSAILKFFTGITLYYTGLFSKNIFDTKSRVFFFSMESAIVKSIFEKVIQITNINSCVRLHMITDCDVEIPYLAKYMADARDFYWGNYAFFKDLYIHLGDDISRDSMKMFLHKNILCQSLSAFIAYNMPPLACTDAWREKRLLILQAYHLFVELQRGLLNFFIYTPLFMNNIPLRGLQKHKKVML